jgi:integrase
MNYKFASHRANLIQEYIKYRRSLGYKYSIISDFITMDKFFITMNKINDIGITRDECDEWSKKRSFEKVGTQCGRVNKMINFSKFLSQLGYKSYKPFPVKFVKTFKPYIFSHEEINEIFIAADKLTCDKKHSCRNMLYIYFRLLYSTGIRRNEGISLTIADVNLIKGTILIRNPKNGKDRILPLSESMLAAMQKYSDKYNTAALLNEPFFRNNDSKRINVIRMNRWFVKILNETNIPYIGGGNGPRIQDLRFTFCCHSLKQLIEKGIDTYVFLPTLSQYMGHSSIQSTEYYLMLTKEIYPELVKNRSKIDSKVFPEVNNDEKN